MSSEQISAAPPSAVRKFPPPCWNPDETLALIHVYRDKWFDLRRRNLRTADWDAVASAVSCRCPATSPPKSSIQCRHKIEKLRKRYRTEKQRSLEFSGRFFSNWDLFPLLDSMEIVPPAVIRSKHDIKKDNGDEDPLLDKVGNRSTLVKINAKIGRNSVSSYPCESVNLSVDQNLAAARPRGKNYGRSDGNRVSLAPVSMERNYTKIEDNFDGDLHFESDARAAFNVPSMDYDDSLNEGAETSGGFPINSLAVRNLVRPPVSRSKKYRKVESFTTRPNYVQDMDYGFSIEVPVNRLKYYPNQFEGNQNADFGSSNCYPSNSRSGYEKKKESRPNADMKREMDPVAEMASSIKLLGEGFVRMEKMKMEMAREIEKMRMEAEIKRTKLIIESQQQIVDAFVDAMVQKESHKKVKMEMPTDS